MFKNAKLNIQIKKTLKNENNNKLKNIKTENWCE